jgi:hypothetical protein
MGHEANAREPEDHHGPCGWFGDGCREAYELGINRIAEGSNVGA